MTQGLSQTVEIEPNVIQITERQLVQLTVGLLVPLLTGLIWTTATLQSLKDDVAHLTWRLDHPAKAISYFEKP